MTPDPKQTTDKANQDFGTRPLSPNQGEVRIAAKLSPSQGTDTKVPAKTDHTR